MKIAFFETLDWEKEYLSKKLLGNELTFYAKDQPVEQNEAEALSNFIGFPITAELLVKFPALKLVATRSTGYDHIDLKACQQRGILVSNVPTYGENTVAEFAFALLLGLSRKIYPAVKRVREQGLFSTAALQGFDLQNKTLGVVGTGHIGTYVVKIARGFGMKVIAFDPHPNQALASEYGFTYASLEDLLKQSDVVTLHVPYMPATHHILNAQNIALCKPGAIIINTARGGLIETSALVAALQSGHLAGAGRRAGASGEGRATGLARQARQKAVKIRNGRPLWLRIVSGSKSRLPLKLPAGNFDSTWRSRATAEGS